MHPYSGSRSASGSRTPKKGKNASLKDASADAGQNVRFCNRIGCNGRIKYDLNMKLRSGEKSKCSMTSSHGDRVDENCSLTTALIKRANADSKRKLSAQVEIDRTESSRSSDSYAQEALSLSRRNPSGYRMEVNSDFANTAASEIGSCTTKSNMRPRKLFQVKSAMQKQNTLLAASVPSVSRSFSNGNGSRYNIRNLKHSSVQDIASSSSSMSKSIGKTLMDKGIPEQETNSSQSGRNITFGSAVDGNLTPSTSNNSSSNSIQSIVVAGEESNRSVNISSKMRLSYRQNMRCNSFARGTAVGFPDNEISANVGGLSLSQNFSANSNAINSYPRASNTGDDRSTPIELNFTHFRSYDALQHYNIAEVLLALERIEHDEELTYEQIHALETSFFPGSLHDQHRNMRLDIDNMSFEELLALEDMMGSVSTAVSEEALAKCLKRSIFLVPPSPCETTIDEDGDGIKCSICQEEYAPGDEIGKLVECQHSYHLSCVNQWLQIKNWCPICKAAADPSH